MVEQLRVSTVPNGRNTLMPMMFTQFTVVKIYAER